MHINNEIGTMQAIVDIAEVIAQMHIHNVYFMSMVLSRRKGSYQFKDLAGPIFPYRHISFMGQKGL